MNQEKTLKTKIVDGFFWKALENGGDQLITLVISIVLARILGPEKYGTMSVMLIFITISNVLIQNGFQTALIQKKEASADDFASALQIELLLSVVLYGIIFLSAPGISVFFQDPQICPMLRVLSLILFFGAVSGIFLAKAARELNFRSQFQATLLSDTVSGLLGIWFALRGAGTWALIFQQLFKSILLVLILGKILKIRFSGRFSFQSVRELFSYGWKVLVSGLIDTVYTNLYTPVIKKLYDPEMVGLYNRANQFPQTAANSAAATFQSVLLPAFSKTQGNTGENIRETRGIMQKTLKIGSYVMFPVMFGIMAVAQPMVRVLLGEQWMGAVPLLRLCCLSYSVWHIHIANLQVINANGRSDIYLKLEILKKICGTLLLFLTARAGVFAMLLVRALFDYVCTFINGWPLGKMIGYAPGKQWKDILPEFLCAAFMGILTYLTGNALAAFLPETVPGGTFLILFLQIAFGVVCYVLLSLGFHLESFVFLKETVRSYLCSRKTQNTGHR